MVIITKASDIEKISDIFLRTFLEHEFKRLFYLFGDCDESIESFSLEPHGQLVLIENEDEILDDTVLEYVIVHSVGERKIYEAAVIKKKEKVLILLIPEEIIGNSIHREKFERKATEPWKQQSKHPA